MKKLVFIAALLLTILDATKAQTVFQNYLPCPLVVTVVCYSTPGCGVVSQKAYQVPASPGPGQSTNVQLADCAGGCMSWRISYQNPGCPGTAHVSFGGCCGLPTLTTLPGCPGSPCQGGGTVAVSATPGFLKVY